MVDRDFALLLDAPSYVALELAKGLLDRAGIPFLIHGHDQDFAELGVAVHTAVTSPSLYVPRRALSRARDALREAWGDDAVDGPERGEKSA